MSEQVEHPLADHGDGQDESAMAELTGNEVVDGVLRSLNGLQDRPLDEHVAVFESAHESLRAALAGAGERPGGPTSG